MQNRALLYLHGFLSSPQSQKAQVSVKWFERLGWKTWVPELNLPPLEVASHLEQLVRQAQRDGWDLHVIGSSLGGFWAGRLGRQFQIPVALINPCLNPWEIVCDFVGTQTIYGSTRTVEVLPTYAQDLKALNDQVEAVAPKEGALVLLSPGDEVLDYRLALRAYDGAQILISSDDDHAMQKYASYLPRIEQFFCG